MGTDIHAAIEYRLAKTETTTDPGRWTAVTRPNKYFGKYARETELLNRLNLGKGMGDMTLLEKHALTRRLDQLEKAQDLVDQAANLQNIVRARVMEANLILGLREGDAAAISWQEDLEQVDVERVVGE